MATHRALRISTSGSSQRRTRLSCETVSDSNACARLPGSLASSRVRGPSRSCLKKSHQFRENAPHSLRVCEHAMHRGVRHLGDGTRKPGRPHANASGSGFRGSPESPAVAAWRLRAAAGAGSPCARTRAYRWAARAHNRTNTMTKGVFNTLAVLRRASHGAKHRGQSKPRQGHKTWRRRGVASFLERARMQVPGRHACACAR